MHPELQSAIDAAIIKNVNLTDEEGVRLAIEESVRIGWNSAVGAVFANLEDRKASDYKMCDSATGKVPAFYGHDIDCYSMDEIEKHAQTLLSD